MKKRTVFRWVGGGLLMLTAYLVNVQVQTWLGEKALRESGLDIKSLDEALALAESQSKLVLADLSAIWCSSCRTLDQRVFSDPEVRNVLAEKYVFARIEYETEEGKAFRQRHQTVGIPVLLVLDTAGNKVRELDVVLDPQKFREQL